MKNSDLSVAILMTCFNRKEKTLRCLESLKCVREGILVDCYLVNDGCTDGTKEAVTSIYPEVKIIDGDGSLFWNMGMRLAFSEAIKIGYDYYIWVNDDVIFYENIIEKLIDTCQLFNNPNKTIVVGYTTDSSLKTVTYGGYKRVKSIIPLKMEMVVPGQEPQRCESFNGNCVLIPNTVVSVLGINSDKYRHGFGDADYGFRAVENGIEVWITNYPVGICEKNTNAEIWNNIKYKASIKEKYKAMTNIRCRPNQEWHYFTKRFGGPLWFLRFISPYIKLVISSFISRL